MINLLDDSQCIKIGLLGKCTVYLVAIPLSLHEYQIILKKNKKKQ